MAEITSSDTINKNESYTIKSLFSGWEQDGYTFSGWNTNANGTGTPYLPSDVVSSGFSSNVDLYAQWTKKHKLTVIVTSFPNGGAIDLTVGATEYENIINKEIDNVLPGTVIGLSTSFDYDKYNIIDDSGHKWDVSGENNYTLSMPDHDYTLNIFVSSSIGTNFQCKDTSGEYTFQGILQGLDEGYSYQVEVPICMIGHYGLISSHELSCRLGYQSSNGIIHYFYNDSNNKTVEHTNESKNITKLIKLHGHGEPDDYPNDGPDGNLGYWMGSQTETGEWKSDAVITSTNGLLGHWVSGLESASWHCSISKANPGGTPCSFYIADDKSGEENKHRIISGPNLNGETFTINPSGEGTCILGIQVKDADAKYASGKPIPFYCAGLGAFVKIIVTRKDKLS